MATKKASNYSSEDMAILATYTGADNATEVPAIAEKLGRSVPAVRSKLASMGVYVKAETPKKRQGTKKQDIADAIGGALSFNEQDAEALGKTTSRVLTKIADALGVEVKAG